MVAALNDPLHGKTLKSIVEFLVERFGWDGLGKRIKLQCFLSDPSINSSLIFLRKTPWARKKVETLYVATVQPGRHREVLSPIRI